MGKIIQLVPTVPGEVSLFITGFEMETSLLTYRSSRIPEREFKENITPDGDGKVQLENGFFDILLLVISFPLHRQTQL